MQFFFSIIQYRFTKINNILKVYLESKSLGFKTVNTPKENLAVGRVDGVMAYWCDGLDVF